MNITMTQEEKKILFKELCARLAYGVKVKVECTTAKGKKIEDEGVLNSIFINEFGTIYVCVDEVEYELEDVKPYLRPLSSMTEDEKDKLLHEHIKDEQLYVDCIKNHPEMRGKIIPHFAADWCDKKMFDFRGLIPKGIALSTDEFNPYND